MRLYQKETSGKVAHFVMRLNEIEKAFNDCRNDCGLILQLESYDSKEKGGRVGDNIREITISCQKDCFLQLCFLYNHRIRSILWQMLP